MDLFDIQREKNLSKDAPLAARLRPATLDEFLGQEHIVGKGRLLYRAIKSDRLSSIILHGPPGTGKTTLAKIIANTTRSRFVQLNATTAGIKDIKTTVDEARNGLGMTGKRTILFIDEIHRFNKTQQDALLPSVEDGTVILVGATTESPYFEVNKALVSRSIIFELKPLLKEDIKKLIYKAVNDNEKGLGMFNMEITDEAADFLADISEGDARRCLNAIEMAALTTEPVDGRIYVDLDVAGQCVQKRPIKYDKNGDTHYDVISAFIKSMRGSDPDAALYYMARMLYAGEDPKFIARRIVICASEDVGNADPHALLVAVAAAQAVQLIGMPEGRLNLAQAVIYVSCAPKSNAVLTGISEAWEDVEKVRINHIPFYLRDTNAMDPKVNAGGFHKEYKYAHNYPGHYVEQEYLPDELADRTYYRPSDNGTEKKIKESLKKLRGYRNYD